MISTGIIRCTVVGAASLLTPLLALAARLGVPFGVCLATLPPTGANGTMCLHTRGIWTRTNVSAMSMHRPAFLICLAPVPMGVFIAVHLSARVRVRVHIPMLRTAGFVVLAKVQFVPLGRL